MEARWNLVCPKVDPKIEAFAARHNGQIISWTWGLPAKHVVWKQEDLQHTVTLATNLKTPSWLYIQGEVASEELVRGFRTLVNVPEQKLSGPVDEGEVKEALEITERALAMARQAIVGESEIFRLIRVPLSELT